MAWRESAAEKGTVDFRAQLVVRNLLCDPEKLRFDGSSEEPKLVGEAGVHKQGDFIDHGTSLWNFS